MPDLSAGLCRDRPGLFYGTDGKHRPQETHHEKRLRENTALGYCHMCPVIDLCAEWAVHHERYGVWGGLTETERQLVRRRLGVHVRTPESFFSLDDFIIQSRVRREGNMTQDEETVA